MVAGSVRARNYMMDSCPYTMGAQVERGWLCAFSFHFSFRAYSFVRSCIMVSRGHSGFVTFLSSSYILFLNLTSE